MNPLLDTEERITKLEKRLKDPLKPTPPRDDILLRTKDDDLDGIKKALADVQRAISSKNSSITEERGSLDMAIEMADRIQKNSLSQNYLNPKGNMLASLEVSGSTSGLLGEKSNRRRKLDKVDKGPDRSSLTPEGMKKTKITPSIKGQLLNLEDKAHGSDSSVASNDHISMNKENTPIMVAAKKITDFFPKKENSPQQQGEGKNSRGKGSKSKLRNFLTEIPDENELSKLNDDKMIMNTKMKEYEVRIRDLEKDKEKRDRFWEEKIEKFEAMFQAYKLKAQQTIAKQVLENENHKRNERKNLLNQQKQRLGEYMQQRDGNKFVDIWMDGYEIRNLKEKIVT